MYKLMGPFLIAIFVSFIAVAQTYIEYTPVNIDGIEGVIVPAEAGFYMPISEEDDNVSGYWTIENIDLLAIENKFENHLKSNLNNPLWQKFRAYKRQYVGIVVEDKKRIFINFFCDPFEFPDSDVSWKNQPLVILDGGDCYFQVQYDLNSKEFMHLYINGEA